MQQKLISTKPRKTKKSINGLFVLLVLLGMAIISLLIYYFVSMPRPLLLPSLASLPPRGKKQMSSTTGPRRIVTYAPLPTQEPVPQIDYDMNGSIIQIRVGDKRIVSLFGNATTGYNWRIVQIDGTSVKTQSKYHYKPTSPFLMGSGGYFQWEFDAVEPGLTDVYFIYDPVAEPQLGYYFYVSFDVSN